MFTDRTWKLPPPPPRASLPCMQCSPPCKRLRSSRPRQGGSKTMQPSPLTTWSSAVLGALRVAPPRGAERRQNARQAAEGLAALISRSRSPRHSRAHPLARSSSLGLGRDRDPGRHFTSPLGAGRRPARPSSPGPLRCPRRGTARLGCPDSSAALRAPNPSSPARHEAGRQLEPRES